VDPVLAPRPGLEGRPAKPVSRMYSA
jgi:hypothetical protein